MHTVKDPLSGLRVIEIGENVAPAYAGKLLAWLGAEVQILQPRVDHAGDPEVQQLVDEWLHEGKTILDETSDATTWAAADVLLLDLDAASPRVRQACEDVQAELDRLDRKPVVVSLSSAHDLDDVVPGSALTAGAWSGLSWSMGSAGRAPLTLPYDLPSFQTGAHAAAAALTGILTDCADPGLRQIDVATRDVLSYYTGMITANFIPYERPWRREGARPPGSGGVYPASIFPCKDGHVTFMCRSQREWDTLLGAMGHPEWSQDPRFADPRVIARLHADEVDQHLTPWIAQHTRDEMLEFGRANGLPIAPVRSFAEVLDEPHFLHRNYFDTHPTRPTLQVPGRPWQIQDEAGGEDLEGPSAVGTGATTPKGLLRGLKVLDLSWVWSGPMVTSMLADLGATVIKVEHEGHMDGGRIRGRARRAGVEVEGPEHEVTPYFNQMSHGKQSITLDLKNARARKVLMDLAAQADVIVENMRPGALDRVGLSYADVVARNPAVVMLSMSMAGQSGPLSALKGYAGIMAAMSGLDSVIGYSPDELIGSLTPALGDPNGASHAITALMAALVRRQRTGHGAFIDLSQIEALLSVTPAPLLQAQVGDEDTVPMNRHPLRVPHGHFRTAEEDSWIALAVATEEQWYRVVELAGQDGIQLGRDWWQTARGNDARIEEVERAVSTWTSSQRRAPLVKRLVEAGVPVAPVNDYAELMSSSWLADRELTVEVQHRYLGPMRIFILPWKFDGAAAGVVAPAPLLGEHTDLVLEHVLGMDQPAIDELRHSGALR